MAACASAASWVAARLATGIASAQLHTAFALFLLVLALYFGTRRSAPAPAHTEGRRLPPAALPLLGVASVSTGVMLAHKLPAARLRLLFCVVLLGTAVAMLATPH